MLLLTACASTAETADAQLAAPYIYPYAVDTATVPQYVYPPVREFRVSGLSPQCETELDYTDWWYCEWDDCRYLFLPATADRANLTVTYTADAPIRLNGTELISGEPTNLLGTDDTFTVEIGDEAWGELHVMQSTLGCMYLELESGSTQQMDEHRSFSDTGTALMLDADGNTVYSGELEKITGHGNSSFIYSKKKPYNFKLPQKAELYGMGAAKKWILISNFLDQSLLRNTAALEMGRQAGLAYTMDSVYIDLYANGSYRGTYQLQEKAQIQENRVDISDLAKETEKLNDAPLSSYERIAAAEDMKSEKPGEYKYYDIPNNPKDITGGYLIEFQILGRADKSAFVTQQGQIIAVRDPEYASREQVEYIRGFVQELEDAVYSDDGYNSKGRHYSDYLDVDSLIIGYLIQEIMENSDGAATSFFFYKDSDTAGDGKLHYGPAWDFDLACMNYNRNATPGDGISRNSMTVDNLYAMYVPISGYKYDSEEEILTNGYNWLMKLYEKPDYAARVSEIFKEKFDSYLDTLTDPEDGFLMQMQAYLAPSADMNNARWHMYGPKSKPLGPLNGNNYAECVEYIRSFLEQRHAFLLDVFG